MYPKDDYKQKIILNLKLKWKVLSKWLLRVNEDLMAPIKKYLKKLKKY